MRFKAKIKWWYYILVALPIINLIRTIIFGSGFSDKDDIVFYVIVPSIALLIFSVGLILMYIYLDYFLTDTSLIIKYGKNIKNSQEILFEDIKSIKMTKTGRLEIKYFYRKKILTGLLYLTDKKEFLEEYEKRSQV